MDGLLNLLPLQVRTLLQAASGDRSAITENTLDEAERKRVAAAILASRTYKQSLLDLNKDNMLNDTQKAEYKKYFSRPEAIANFKSGSGAVGYDDYYNAGQGMSDWNIFPSGGVRNTLGQFRYDTDKKGNVTIKDTYDFMGDMIEGLPKQVAYTERYEKLSPAQKVGLLAKETFVMPEVGFSPMLGIKSLPSRAGNAFVGGTNVKNVNIKLPPKYQINPTEQDLYYTRLGLTK
jgi:hypothetical protein